MAKNENERIKFLKELEQDTNEITVAKVVYIFRSTLRILDSKTQTFKNVKKKLGEDQYIRMMDSLINSFLSTLYINAGKDKAEQKARFKKVNKINEDLTASIVEEEKIYDA